MKHSSVITLAVFLAGSLPLLAGAQSVVPEPSSLAVTALGVAALVLLARKKRSR